MSSYTSIRGIDKAIRGSLRATMGRAEWTVTGAGTGGVPESLLAHIRSVGAVAAPFVKASVSIREPALGALQVWGVDTRTDSMARMFGVGGLGLGIALALVPNGVLVAKGMNVATGSELKVATRTGPASLRVLGTVPDSPITRTVGGPLALMDLEGAERLFGQPGRLDLIAVSGISSAQLHGIAKGLTVRPAYSLSVPAQDALLRIQSLYALSLIAVLIGGFAVFSSVQVTVMERMRELSTFRAIGASRSQILGAVLLEWLLVGAAGSVGGVFLGLGIATVVIRYVVAAVNAQFPLIADARPDITWRGALIGASVGLLIVVVAAAVPAATAAGTSPLAALRPYTYRLRNRQVWAFWGGLALLTGGLVLSSSGTYTQTLIAIAISFLGMGLALPQAVLFVTGASRRIVARIAAFPGFLAADNLRKAPQRTAFNVIVLGGALIIMVSTAAVASGLTVSTHDWIRSALVFDLSIAASDMSAGSGTEETLPHSLLAEVEQVPGVSLAYGVRRTFTEHDGNEVLVLGVPVSTYLEAHRRKGAADWVAEFGRPGNLEALRNGTGLFASNNFLALTGMRAGQPLELPTPSGIRPFRILGGIDDYSWPRGVLILDLDVVDHLWKSDRLSYVDVQVANPSQTNDVRRRLEDATLGRFQAIVIDRARLFDMADDVLRQSTAAANVQVWLAAIIGFLGIGNSLVLGVLQRQREIGLLRAIGMSRRQLQLTVALEALLIGIAAGTLGALGGLAGGWLPLRHFTLAITGYLFPIVIPWQSLVLSVAASVAISLLAAIIPVGRVGRLPVLESIGME